MIKPTLYSLTLLAGLMLAGCSDTAEKKAKPTFMFWCFRNEIQEETFHVPELKGQADAKAIQPRLIRIPGYVDATFAIESNSITVKYQSSTTRKMNFEEAIAQAGYAVNNRPAYPKTSPKGK